MKKIILVLLFTLVLFGGYILYDMKKTIEERTDITNKISCFLGNGNACFWDMWYYSYEDMNQSQKMKAWENLCENKDQVDSCDELSKLYSFGYSSDDIDQSFIVKPNDTKAVFYYEKACSLSLSSSIQYSRACTNLEILYTGEKLKVKRYIKPLVNESFKLDRDIPKAIYYADRACRKNEESSCRFLAEKFLSNEYKSTRFGKDSFDYSFRLQSFVGEKRAKIYLNIECARDLNIVIHGRDGENYSTTAACRKLVTLDNMTNLEKRNIYERLCIFNTKRGKHGSLYGEECYQNGLLYKEGSEFRQDLLKAKEYFGMACDLGYKTGCKEYADLPK